MDGINFVVNEQKEQVAVIIDLKKYEKIWEDFYDILLAQQRQNEPRESLDTIKAQWKTNG